MLAFMRGLVGWVRSLLPQCTGRDQAGIVLLDNRLRVMTRPEVGSLRLRKKRRYPTMKFLNNSVARMKEALIKLERHKCEVYSHF